LRVLDLHSDIITDIAHRRYLGERKVFERRHLPRFKKAGVIGAICALWVEPIFRMNSFQRFQQLLQSAIEDLSECEEVEVVTEDSIEEMEKENGKFFVCLGLEGLSFVEEWEGAGEIDRVSKAIHSLTDNHIRHAILAWNEVNFLASGTGAYNYQQYRGLTEAGKYAVKRMETSHWMIDVSHLDEPSFWDVVASADGPILASHSNAKSLCNVERNLTDAQLKAIAEKKGIVGLNAYGEFVDSQKPTLERFADHLCYMCDLIGVDHVGFGFDFTDYLQDYNIGLGDYVPTAGLEDVTKVPNLIEEMERRGFQHHEIEKICYRNAMDFFKNSLRGAANPYET